MDCDPRTVSRGDTRPSAEKSNGRSRPRVPRVVISEVRGLGLYEVGYEGYMREEDCMREVGYEGCI